MFVAIVAAIAADRDRDGAERLAVDGRTHTKRTHNNATARPSVSTDTTVALLPVTTGVPVPDPTTVARATVAPPGVITATPSQARPPAPALTSSGAVLTVPETAPPRSIDKAKGCHSAADPGWKIVECGALRGDSGVLVWLVEGRGKGLRALVLREQTANAWMIVAAALDDDGTRFTKIGVRGDDLSGDSRPELVFGFHRVGPGATLALDLVEGTGRVAVHRELPRGGALLAKGELTVWAALDDGTGAFERVAIRFAVGAWRAVATERVQPRDVPTSMV